jgi:hypothetical protein
MSHQFVHGISYQVGRKLLYSLSELVYTNRVLLDPLEIHPVIREKKVLDAVEKCDVRADLGLQVYSREFCCVRKTRVYNNDFGWIRSSKPVQNTRPQNCLSSSHVMAA